MNLSLEEKRHAKSVQPNTPCILAADVGGTNANFGVFAYENGQLTLLVSLHARTETIVDFTAAVQQVLERLKKDHSLTPQHACIGAAGLLATDGASLTLTNAPFSINTTALQEKTSLEHVLLINDMQAIGSGIDVIDSRAIKIIRAGSSVKDGTRAIVAAGTGLGKSMLSWHENTYIAHPSEGGHADFPAHNTMEMELQNFVKNQAQTTQPVSWEQLLSGRGIQQIYRFCQWRDVGQSKEQAPEPATIFEQQSEAHCTETFEQFARFYGRCVKNTALETVARGGVYIAGGIAAHNAELFDAPTFHEELRRTYQLRELLDQIPIHVILDYNISLYGAAAYLLRNLPT